jgi:hypothetical protein
MTEPVWVHRTMIVPAPLVLQAQDLADRFGPAAHGMWTTPLSPTGDLPATHFISSGLIDQPFADMMSSPDALVAGCASLGITVPLATAQALLGASDVSGEDPFAAMERLGLQMVRGVPWLPAPPS